MVTKLDIMNSRGDEEWKIVNGKVQRIEKEVEKKKVTGPVVQNAIKKIEIKESTSPKKPKSKKTKGW